MPLERHKVQAVQLFLEGKDSYLLVIHKPSTLIDMQDFNNQDILVLKRFPNCT